ncbi:MAG TPA: M48 family metalloprotease [Euzebyales bacterium]
MSHRRSESSLDVRRLPGGVVPWSIVVVIVAVGALAVLARPLAPDLGPVPDPGRWFTTPQLERIAAYQRPLRWAVLLATIVDVAVPVTIAVTATGRRLVARVVNGIGVQRPGRAAAAVTVVIVGLTTLVGLPVDLWAHRHARLFGLSTQSLAGWAGDRAIELAITAVGAALVVGVGYALAARWPRRWVLVAIPLGLLATAVLTLSAPLILEPLRYRVTPLPPGEVRDELTDVLAAEGRGDAALLVADASRRTTRQNAYVSGLAGTRRIVLFDTLLERPPPEVALIVAHELAHERHRDLARGVLAGGAGLAVVCALVDGVARWRVRRGRQDGVADPMAAGVVVAVLVVTLMVTAPVSAWVSRRAEAAADLGSLELTGAVADYCAVQRGLVVRNLSDPAPPTWARLWWWTHPPAASRLQLASTFDDAACAN